MRREFNPRAAWAGSLGAAPFAALGAILLLGTAVLLLYRGALGNGLVSWDDDIYLERIPQLHGWSGANLLWMWTDRTWFYWHPVAYMDHACDLSTFGADWRMHHLMSLFLHFFNAVGVLVLACAFLGPREGEEPRVRPAAVVGAAFLAALLWALHPLRVEPVAWLAEKKELLCAFASLAATAAWLLRWRTWTWVAFLLAVGAKPTAVALPAAWFVLDIGLRGAEIRRAARAAAPFVLAGMVAVVLGATGVKEEGRVSAPLGLGLDQRLLTPLWGYASPLVKTLVPLGLSPMDPQFDPREILLLTPRWGGSFLLLAGLTWLAFKRRGGFAVAWFAYFALAAPVSGLRQLANLATADRFSYLPTIPFYLLAAAGILRFGRGAAAAALVAAGALAALSLPQIAVWHDPVTLWTRVLAQWPDRGPEPHDHLGAWYAHEGKEAEAIEEFRASLRIAEANPTAHNNLGRMLEGRGDFSGAEKEYRRSAALAPAFAVTRWNLARMLARRGRKAEAEKWYREALATGGWVHPSLRAEVEGLLGIAR